MEEKNTADFNTLIKDKDYHTLKKLLSVLHAVDVAGFIGELSGNTAITIFRMLPKGMAAEVFVNLEPDVQERIIGGITDREISFIIEELFVDDAVDLLEELPANVVKRVLQNAGRDTRLLINQFLQYPENSAGSIMTAEFIDLRKTMTVRDAFLRIRRTGLNKETVYTCYVIDENRRLEGVVTVKTLFLSNDDDIIGDTMNRDCISAITTDDREAVALLFSKYGLLSIPVVDHEDRLVGIITVDDAVDVIEREATEDFEKMAAMLPSEKPYLKTSVLALAKNRILWLLILMISAMITGKILEQYEAAFTVLPLLVTFIPMLTDTGGNAGSQSSTLIIRGMALAEIKSKDFLRVFWKELRVSLVVGSVLALVNFTRLILMYPGKRLIALTVALSLFVTVIAAKTIGGILPMVAKLIKTDPAIMAAPLITTIIDAFSLIIYFTLAKYLLGF